MFKKYAKTRAKYKQLEILEALIIGIILMLFCANIKNIIVFILETVVKIAGIFA